MTKVFLRKVALAVLAACVLGSGLMLAQNKYGKPKSVIHVVTVRWAEGTTPQQIRAALSGVEKLAATYPGIRNVWLRSIKVQGEGYTHAFVMEFESEKALADYSNSPQQLEWYKLYTPIRGESTTHDITN
jgi:hypothetical protein